MSDDDAKTRGAGRQVRAVSHARGGGHSPYRLRREPNTVDPLHPSRHQGHARMTIQEYPKWLHFEAAPSVLVKDAEEEAAELASRAPAPRRGRPPKAPEPPVVADDEGDAPEAP